MSFGQVLRSKLFLADTALRLYGLNPLSFLFSFTISRLGFLRFSHLLGNKVNRVAWLVLMILLYYFEADSFVESH